MIFTLHASCWFSADGRALRFLRRGERYLLPPAAAMRLVQASLATLTDGDSMRHYPPRQLVLLSPPQFEPITLAEAKLFLRVDGSEEDSLIFNLLTTARQKAESWMRRSLLTQSWQLEQRYESGKDICLPLGPIQSVTQVQVIRLETTTTLDAAQYRFDPTSATLTLTAIYSDIDRVRVSYQAGYADPALIPAPIRHGILQALSHYYHHREMAEDLSAEAKRLLNDYREIRI